MTNIYEVLERTGESTGEGGGGSGNNTYVRLPSGTDLTTVNAVYGPGNYYVPNATGGPLSPDNSPEWWIEVKSDAVNGTHTISASTEFGDLYIGRLWIYYSFSGWREIGVGNSYVAAPAGTNLTTLAEGKWFVINATNGPLVDTNNDYYVDVGVREGSESTYFIISARTAGTTDNEGRLFTYTRPSNTWQEVGGTAQVNSITGWASYIDTQYPTSGTAFTVAANTVTRLPNNAGTVIDHQKPLDITSFYASNLITGRNGDAMDIMIYFKAVPSNVNQWLDIWVDIGGTVDELYRETFTFPKGSGVTRSVAYSLSSIYTLDTFQANGGTVYVESNHSVDVYDLNFNFDRSHKAR